MTDRQNEQARTGSFRGNRAESRALARIFARVGVPGGRLEPRSRVGRVRLLPPDSARRAARAGCPGYEGGSRVTQLALFPALADPRCSIRDAPFADGRGSVRVHECGRYAGNIWPCHKCGWPGDRSVPAVAEYARLLEASP